ncbi:MAG: fibrobacter succinogenes major paralogous domain-containing protein [Bacteroidales bacterium]|nr:fibrobacter succinogenes major paralogous domain-containing protein [Bacteroidales bacterium]
MKIRLSSILALAVLSLSLLSCKEEEETKEYMDGTLLFTYDIPVYVMPGEKYQTEASGITAPDGTPVAYYFSNTANSKRDTVKTAPFKYTYTIPDTLGTFSLSCTAFAVESSSKYYVSSASTSFIIVDDDPDPEQGSVTGWKIRPDEISESLYGRDYYVVEAGGKNWIRYNLCRVDYDASGAPVFGRAFAGCKAMQNILGGYYTWEEAQKACPTGWHLPSEADWVALLKASGAPDSLQPFEESPCGAGKLMVNASFNGTLMWDYYRGVKISDDSISLIPAGFATVGVSGYEFTGSGDFAVVWTSDEYEGKGVYRYVNEQSDCVYIGMADKTSFAASVRCVR